MSRKGSSGIKPTAYTEYKTVKESKDGLGLGNGGYTDQWMNGLSVSEGLAIEWYTGSAFAKFNEALREGDPPKQDAVQKRPIVAVSYR